MTIGAALLSGMLPFAQAQQGEPSRFDPSAAAAPLKNAANQPTLAERQSSAAGPADGVQTSLVAPQAPPVEGKSLPLAAPSRTLALEPPTKAGDAQSPKSPSLASVFAGLAIVLGLFFLLAWVFKRGMPKSAATLPTEVVQVLGRTPLGPRNHLHLLRVGSKLLLVSLASGCAETLTEIDDPAEVDRLAGLCQQAHPASATNAFRTILQQFGSGPTAGPPGDSTGDLRGEADHA